MTAGAGWPDDPLTVAVKYWPGLIFPCPPEASVEVAGESSEAAMTASVVSGAAILRGPRRQSASARTVDQPLPILKILVPQTGQVPVTAGLPFFMVVGWASLMSR